MKYPTRLFKRLLLVFAATLITGQASADVTARLGTSLPDTHPQTLGAREFARLVNEKTDGDVTVQVFSNGMLGNDVNMTSMVQSATLDFTVPSTATLASLNPNFSIISLPFQFNDEVHAYSVLDGPVGQSLLASLEDKGLEGMGFWENGFRQITNSRRPIETVEDLKGLKVRTMENRVYIDMFNELGANAVPMPVNELFTALETRTVDAQENPYSVIDTKRFYEVQSYLSRTAHAYDAQVLVASKAFMEGLDDDQRQAVREAAQEATRYQRAQSRELNARLLDTLGEKMQSNAVSQAERQRMQQQLAPMLDAQLKALDPQLVTEFKQAIADGQGN